MQPSILLIIIALISGFSIAKATTSFNFGLSFKSLSFKAMDGITASDLQNVLNSTPIEVYEKMFATDTMFLQLLGGLKVGKARLQQPIHASGNSAVGSFGEGDDLSVGGKQGRNMAEKDYGRVYGTIQVDGLQQAISNNGGVVGIKDVVIDETIGIVEDILSAMNTMLLSDGTGNSGKDLDGVELDVDDGGTWAGLLRSTYTYTQAHVNDNSGTPRNITEALMKAVHNTLVNTRKSGYNQIWSDPAMADAYEDLMADRKRWIQVTRGDIKFDSLAFKSRPVIEVPGFPTGKMKFVKASDHEVLYLPQTAVDGTGQKITGPFKVEQVAKNSDDSAFNIIIYAQYFCKNPFKQASLDDLQ